MFKKLALTAGAALFAVPALAADLELPEPTVIPEVHHHMVTGHLSMAAGYGHFDQISRGYTGNALLEGAARFNLNFNQHMNVQFDLNAYAASNLGRDEDTIFETSSIALTHLWYGTESHAIGAFAGTIFGLGDVVYVAGVEGEAYFGSTAVGGQISYNGQPGNNSCCFGEAWNFRAWAKHYINPDLKVFAEGQYLIYDDVLEVWGISGGVEKRHTGKPLSGFAELRYGENTRDTEYGGVVGFRLFADQPGSTLYDHDMRVPWNFRIVNPGREFRG